MKKIFTKIKDDCYYGILIANYPVDHPMNKIGFTGIKVYKWRTSKTLLKEDLFNNIFQCMRGYNKIKKKELDLIEKSFRI